MGRLDDEQHCLFAGHLLKVGDRTVRRENRSSPKSDALESLGSTRVVSSAAIETNSLLPLSDGSFKTSGWLRWKTRLMKKMGMKVAVLNGFEWRHLSEEQKEQQVLKLRAELGYIHDAQVEKRFRGSAGDSWTPNKL